MNEIKNKLKLDYSKINSPSYNPQILNKVEYVEQKNHKFLKFSLVFTALAACVLTCVFVFKNDESNVIDTINQNLSYEVIMLANTLDHKMQNLRMKKQTNNNEEEFAQEIHKYLMTGEMLFNKENIKSTTYNSDKENYKYKIVSSYHDFTSFTNEYVFYYNEKTINNNYFNIEGIIIFDEQEYKVLGNKKIEEKKELETELKIFISDTEYTEISQESKINENEYEYKFYKDNELIKEISLENKIENNKKELEIEIVENNIEKQFEFEFKNNLIECEFEFNDEEIKLEITIEQEYYLYKFLGQEEKIIKISKSTNKIIN